jgi:hypothetical protein
MAKAKVVSPSSVVSKAAFAKLVSQLNKGSKVSGAFVEEHGPSWVEWRGEHKKPGRPGEILERAVVTATFDIIHSKAAIKLKGK